MLGREGCKQSDRADLDVSKAGFHRLCLLDRLLRQAVER